MLYFVYSICQSGATAREIKEHYLILNTKFHHIGYYLPVTNDYECLETLVDHILKFRGV